MPNFIFDLDGTTLNTLADLANACNNMLLAHGFPLREKESYRLMVGNGFPKLVERVLPDGQAFTAEEMAGFLKEAKANYCRDICVETVPYPGMTETLAELKRRGCRLAVLSNKVESMTQELIAHFFPGLFSVVRGGRDNVPLKPDPTAVYAVMDELGESDGTTYYVGDSNVDMLTAKNAGLPAIGCAWGFRGEDEVRAAGAWKVIHEARELLDLPARADAAECVAQE